MTFPRCAGRRHAAITLAVIAAGLLITGCRRAVPARIAVGDKDTVVIHGRGDVVLPVRAFDDKGNLIKHWDRPSLELLEGTVGQVVGTDRVRCDARGDLTVRASAGTATALVLVRCLPLWSIRATHEIQLVVGDAPVALDVAGFDEQGRLVPALAGTARIGDTSIAVVTEGLVYARSRGRTTIEFTIGDCTTLIVVVVRGRAFDVARIQPGEIFRASIRLSPGQRHTWGIMPGTYGIQVDADDTAHLKPIEDSVTCSELRDNPRYYLCNAQPGSGWGLQYTAPAGYRDKTVRVSFFRGEERNRPASVDSRATTFNLCPEIL